MSIKQLISGGLGVLEPAAAASSARSWVARRKERILTKAASGGAVWGAPSCAKFRLLPLPGLVLYVL